MKVRSRELCFMYMNIYMLSPQDKTPASTDIFSMLLLSPPLCSRCSRHSWSFWKHLHHVGFPGSARPESWCVPSELSHTPSHWERSNFLLCLNFHSQSASTSEARRLDPGLSTGRRVHMWQNAPTKIELKWWPVEAADWSPNGTLPAVASASAFLQPPSAMEEESGWSSPWWGCAQLFWPEEVVHPHEQQGLQEAALWTSRMGQKMLQGDAEDEKAGDVWALRGSDDRLGSSSDCRVVWAVRRTVDCVEATEMMRPSPSPSDLGQLSHFETGLEYQMHSLLVHTESRM